MATDGVRQPHPLRILLSRICSRTPIVPSSPQTLVRGAPEPEEDLLSSTSILRADAAELLEATGEMEAGFIDLSDATGELPTIEAPTIDATGVLRRVDFPLDGEAATMSVATVPSPARRAAPPAGTHGCGP